MVKNKQGIATFEWELNGYASLKKSKDKIPDRIKLMIAQQLIDELKIPIYLTGEKR